MFQVVISSLSTLGFYSTLPDIKQMLKVQPHFLYKEKLMTYDRQTIELIIFGFFVASILVNLFVAIITWYCYLHLEALVTQEDDDIFNMRITNNGYDGGFEMVINEDEKGMKHIRNIFKCYKHSKNYFDAYNAG